MSFLLLISLVIFFLYLRDLLILHLLLSDSRGKLLSVEDDKIDQFARTNLAPYTLELKNLGFTQVGTFKEDGHPDDLKGSIVVVYQAEDRDYLVYAGVESSGVTLLGIMFVDNNGIPNHIGHNWRWLDDKIQVSKTVASNKLDKLVKYLPKNQTRLNLNPTQISELFRGNSRKSFSGEKDLKTVATRSFFKPLIQAFKSHKAHLEVSSIQSDHFSKVKKFQEGGH